MTTCWPIWRGDAAPGGIARYRRARGTWPALVAAATFDSMRARANRLVPAPPGVLIDNTAFFRRGASGSGRELLTGAERARYHACAAQMAPSDLLSWLHREGG